MDRRSAAIFHHHLATMLDAGIALPDAIETAGRGTAGRWPARTAEWANACRNGQSLAEAIGDDLDGVDVALIAAGESSGDLPGLCRSLAAWHEQVRQLIRLVIGRAAYPIVVIHLAVTLPGVVLWFTNKAPAWAILIGPGMLWATLAVIALILRLGGDSTWLARVALVKPWSTLSWPVIANRTCRVLRAGVMAGLLHRRSLELAAAGCGNRVVAQRLLDAGAGIDTHHHADLASALDAVGLPRDVVVGLATGDRSGSLDIELTRQIAVLDHRVAERLEWAGRLINGTIYGTAVIIAVIAIINMMRGYVGVLEQAMG